MGSITARKSADGSVSYRAAIRINKKGYPAYSESKTFYSKKVAENWLKKEKLRFKKIQTFYLAKNN